MNVLTTCGHTVGLKQSPSVVFSSSSDLAVEKQGAGQQPSSEEASLTEGLSNESKDELEPQQVGVRGSCSDYPCIVFSYHLKGLRHEDFAVLGQFCAKTVTLHLYYIENAPVKLRGRYQMNFIRES